MYIISFIRPPLTWWSGCCTVVASSEYSESYNKVVGASLSVLVIFSGTCATGLSGGLRDVLPSSLGCAQPPCLVPMPRVSSPSCSRLVRPHHVLLWPPCNLLLLSPLPRLGSCPVQAPLVNPMQLEVGSPNIAIPRNSPSILAMSTTTRSILLLGAELDNSGWSEDSPLGDVVSNRVQEGHWWLICRAVLRS
jgi:hypothetical protein